MNTFLHGVIRASAEAFDMPAPIYEIGSYQVEGQEDFADLRGLFPGKKYVGVDMRAGKGVDLVADIQEFAIPDGSVGTLIASSTFEHVPRFWKGFEEIGRVVRADGLALITVPFMFYIHNYPGDYWRFTPLALDMLLERFPYRILGWHGPAKRPINVWAVAFGKDRPQPSKEQLERYAGLLRNYAHEKPQPWRTLRYRAARVLCGRGPFASHLEQDHWELECRTGASGGGAVWSARNR